MMMMMVCTVDMYAYDQLDNNEQFRNTFVVFRILSSQYQIMAR